MVRVGEGTGVACQCYTHAAFGLGLALSPSGAHVRELEETIAARVDTWRARFAVQALIVRATTDILPLPPKSALAVALGYLLGQRASLTRCLTTPGNVMTVIRAFIRELSRLTSARSRRTLISCSR